jgi:hypothetical protein
VLRSRSPLLLLQLVQQVLQQCLEPRGPPLHRLFWDPLDQHLHRLFWDPLDQHLHRLFWDPLDQPLHLELRVLRDQPLHLELLLGRVLFLEDLRSLAVAFQL